MENEKAGIEDRLRNAVSDSVPDVIDTILSACDQQKGIVMDMNTNTTATANKKRKRKSISLIASAAALVLVLGGFLGINQYQAAYAADSRVSIDVNPSIELEVSKDERVLKANALNKDALTILDGMDFKGVDLDVAVHAIIGSLLEHGYIDDAANSLLLTVENNDTAKSSALEKKLVAEIEGILKTNQVAGSVIGQTSKQNADLKALADSYGISTGKAALIQDLLLHNKSYTFEGLAGLSVNELNLLSQSKKNNVDDLDTVGVPSDKAYIGNAAAAAAAYKHAGINSKDSTKLDVEFDYEHGKMIYDVEFSVGNMEYEYKIDATTAAVLKSKNKLDDDATSNGAIDNDDADDQDDAAEDAEEAKREAAEDAEEAKREAAEDAAEAKAEAEEKAKDAAEDAAEAKAEAEEKARDAADEAKDAADDDKDIYEDQDND